MISRGNSKFIFSMFFVNWLKFLLEYLQDIWLSFTWWLVEEEVSFVLKCFCKIRFLIVDFEEYLHDILWSFTWWLVEEEVSFVLKCFCEIRFLIVNILIVVATHQSALVVAHCPGGKQKYCLAADIWNLKKIVLLLSVLNKRMVSFDGMEWNLT